ncbi:Putative P-Loop ATPase [Vibrio harveyi]|uniref:AAA family ATPase n=1 Tax=Vibrio harveyi TaxID=669 RepID=UPI002ADA6708|nr:AAA family ATPase [Vibrio harveyi]CAK6714491.1 Putative P-Loop ATPase [Vibrio harveyi]
MSFRVKSFYVEKGHFSTPVVNLSKNETTNNENYFTVLIGNNGTGKSRFLVNLVDSFKNINERNGRVDFNYGLEYEINGNTYNIEKNRKQKVLDRFSIKEEFDKSGRRAPDKIIAITTSLSDKFPVEKRNKNKDLELRKKDSYSYLGVRNRTGAASNRALMDKAMSIMISSINDSSYNEEYRDIFDYLNYEPVLKLEYRVVLINKDPSYIDRLDFRDFKELIRSRAENRGSFRQSSVIQMLETKDDSYWKELADGYFFILNNLNSSDKRRVFTILLNFSLENINREMDDFGIDEFRFYKILEELRRFELVRGPEIKLYKKDGGEFDFNDASSGEASILSTLIALIPELEDNSLVVIDEPEISLHPSWQYRYVNLLDRIITKKSGCHIFIATHSHFIISDLPIGRSYIVHLKKGKKSSIEVEYIEQETQGLSAEDILLNVFDMPSTRNYYLSQQVSEALEILASGEKKNNRYSELVNKFKGYIPNMNKADPLYDVLKKLVNLGD